ncbi:MAG TPA: dihydropteroate synthase [Steroidobacteraceae bacterium]|jgi:dihydropteroate synthase
MRLLCAGRVLELDRPAVMGVLNVTPDSFSDGGRYLDADAALAQAERMAAEGAAIIDIGGESTRPGAAAVAGEEELRRVLPVLERVAARLPVLLSVDTSNPEVIRRASAAGAHLVNDVRALRSPGALEAVAGSALGVCLMHMQGEPASMQANPRYDDVVEEVKTFLAERVQTCIAAGIARERLCIDPGFGFGKLLAHNLQLLRDLAQFERLGLPLAVGLSRKSMVTALGGRSHERLAGSLALATIAVLQGVQIVRAHDVAATVDAVRVADAVRRRSSGG